MYMSFAYRFSVAMEICLYALFVILGLPITFTGQPACRDNQEEFGFALVGHDYKSVYADHFSRCYFECTSEERCQSVTYLWDQKECKMNNETKKSRPEDYVQNPAATYMENTFRGIVNLVCKPFWKGGDCKFYLCSLTPSLLAWAQLR